MTTTVLGVPDQINLDYAATAPCARAAADAVAELLPWYGSVHRGAGALSQRSTLAYEVARQAVGDFLGARAGDHVIFTRNTTDALNLLARALPAGTPVVTYGAEHHANLLPWPVGAVRLPVPDSPGAAIRALDAALRQLDAPALVAVTGASNVTGERWPVAELAAVAHRHGARIAVDAAQLAPHAPIDIADLDLDYVAVSGHKLYAPFGAGVLAGRGDWLDAAPPYLTGAGRRGTWARPPTTYGGRPGRPGTRRARPTCSARWRSRRCARPSTRPPSRRPSGPWSPACGPGWPRSPAWPSCACSTPAPSGWASSRSWSPGGTPPKSPPNWPATTASAYATASSAPIR
ncbi:hypothetical protein Prum_046330 [Phytohabitans rumicis]|uniref:Aminotransferase class V domain-containing protein n=1 Tax=Phytohabitans rumicis TaxID=1076125 RepID=A0A6V8L852_9ACTN|nr:hypothetical protein Prum_046330 [Phytohabitans rumicis]